MNIIDTQWENGNNIFQPIQFQRPLTAYRLNGKLDIEHARERAKSLQFSNANNNTIT